MCCIMCIIAMEGGEEGAAEEEAAYQAISAKETTDLRALMQVTDMYNCTCIIKGVFHWQLKKSISQ